MQTNQSLGYQKLNLTKDLSTANHFWVTKDFLEPVLLFGQKKEIHRHKKIFKKFLSKKKNIPHSPSIFKNTDSNKLAIGLR